VLIRRTPLTPFDPAAEITVLHSRYAHRLAHIGGLDATRYERTADGLAHLLRATAAQISVDNPLHDALAELGDYAQAAGLLGRRPEAHRILRVVSNTLAELIPAAEEAA